MRSIATMPRGALLSGAFLALAVTCGAVWAQAGPQVESVAIPAGVDVFDLDLAGIRTYSSAKNFEVVGHSYFKIAERTPWAKAEGRPGAEVGSGFNTVRVDHGVAYLGGYTFPPTLFHIVIADVSDPAHIRVLSTIACNPGTRCNYLRLNAARKILVIGHDDDRGNPTRPPAGEKSRPGWSFYDVSDPRQPALLGFVAATPGGKTHGLDLDDRYLYACSQSSADLNREAVQIVDYADPRNIHTVGAWHVAGQLKGEARGPLDRNNPDGTPQIIQCHEINYYNDRLYVAFRDAGMQVLDVTDRSQPKLLATYDYVPPFHGGFLGASHTSMPVVVTRGEHPDLVIQTDEIFDCPQGFGRILDVSDLKNPEVVRGARPANVALISTFRLPHVSDAFDYAKKAFVCPEPGGPTGTLSNTTHQPMQDLRSPSLIYVTWYDEGVRVLDISNPSAPAFVGHYLSPRFASPGRKDRHTREVWQDPETMLIYMTDGNGGGLTVLRYTGPIPTQPPSPGAR
jgi:hypothetical protein